MSLVGVILQVVSFPSRVKGGLDVDHVPRGEVLGRTVEWDLVHPGETVVDGEDAVGTVITSSDGYFFRLQVGLSYGDAAATTTSLSPRARLISLSTGLFVDKTRILRKLRKSHSTRSNSITLDHHKWTTRWLPGGSYSGWSRGNRYGYLYG